jgi:metal-sulfur cluster biosynthetic enzyme
MTSSTHTPSETLSAAVTKQLAKVLDPELGVSITDLGLIYGVEISNTGVCVITMTLTTIGCPLFGSIQKEIEDRVMELEGIEDIKIDLVFEPTWTPERMTKETRIRLGLD